MRLRQVAKVNSFAPHRAESCCPGALMQRTIPGLRSKATTDWDCLMPCRQLPGPADPSAGMTGYQAAPVHLACSIAQS